MGIKVKNWGLIPYPQDRFLRSVSASNLTDLNSKNYFVKPKRSSSPKSSILKIPKKGVYIDIYV